MRTVFCGTLLGMMLSLGGCKTPFANRLSNIDWSGPAAPGTIAVSQPKMYQRASLINERRDEEVWIAKLLDDSKIAVFTPEIVREVEQITTFAAALGLSFDPASALNYKRANETGSIQQQMDVAKLQLQLDQLKRDAELVRSTFAAQTTPVNADLGKVGATGTTAAVPVATAAAADQLTAAMARLATAMSDRLDANAKGPASVTASTNPAELFRDRSALRDLLKSAKKAASLDDLHDAGGGALIRLNFQAMVLPARENSRAPGVVQMTLKKPELKSIHKERIYRGWIDHVNRTLNVVTAAGWKPNVTLLASAAADNFDLVEYQYAVIPPPAPPARGKLAPAPSPCQGFVLTDSEKSSKCSTLLFAVPKFAALLPQEKGYASLQDYLTWFEPGKSDAVITNEYETLDKLMLGHAKAVVVACKLQPPAPVSVDGQPNPAYFLYRGVKKSQLLAAAGDVLARIDRAAQQTLRHQKISAPRSSTFNHVVISQSKHSRQFLANFRRVAFEGCASEQIQEFQDSAARLYIPPGVESALDSKPRIAVYEIGPREQVQQVSSIARVANNFSLAAALAASAPGSGSGVKAAADYARQATGKAATIERVPVLIGYSTSDETFGWVFGPKATLDPAGDIRLEQTPRTFDLSVDLSIPGWWPWFTLETVTGWTPTPLDIAAGTIENIPGFVHTNKVPVEVPMATTYADYEVLSALIKRGGTIENREVSLDDEEFVGQSVSACRGATIYMSGPNIWRATSVLIGGHQLHETAITVAPDMSGIFLAVPALDDLLVTDAGPRIAVSVFTRYDDATGNIAYVPKPTPAGCPVPVKTTAASVTVNAPVAAKPGT